MLSTANQGWLEIRGDKILAPKITSATAQTIFTTSINTAGKTFPQTPKAARDTTPIGLEPRFAATAPTPAKTDVVTIRPEIKTNDWASDAPDSLWKAAKAKINGVAAIDSQDQLSAAEVLVLAIGMRVVSGSVETDSDATEVSSTEVFTLAIGAGSAC